MASNQYYDRMLLREGADRDAVEMITSAGSWPLVEHNVGEASESYMLFRTWGVAPGLWISYLEDLTTKASVLIAFGSEQEQVEELSRRISIILQPYSRSEVLELPAQEENKQKRIQAIIRVALAAGERFDPEIFGVISDASRDPDLEIRNAAVWATTYLLWPQSLLMLREIAADDPDEWVKKAAQELLADFQGSES